MRTLGRAVTRIPGAMDPTSSPTAATTPLNSWPTTTGTRIGIAIASSYTCRSEPQMPAASTSTSTSPGPGTGSATSRTSMFPGPRAYLTSPFTPFSLSNPLWQDTLASQEVAHSHSSGNRESPP